MPQERYPDVWSCESDNKTVAVEIGLPTSVPNQVEQIGGPENPFDWIEIPTTSVETWIEKGESSRLQRTSKVKFPTEWGDGGKTIDTNSPRQLIQQFTNDTDENNPFLFARVWYRSSPTEPWVLNQFGWIGGVGQTADQAVSKMWIYDVSEMLSAVPVDAHIENPTVRNAVVSITKIIVEQSRIPVTNAFVFPPDTEENAVTNAVAERSEIRKTPSQLFEIASESTITFDDVSQTELNNSDIEFPKDSDEITVTIVDTPTSDIETIENINLTPKTFTRNQDTLRTVFDWYEQKAGAKITFEPQMNGVAVVADIVPERRVFAHDKVIDFKLDSGELDYQFHDVVRVLKNNALYEMKPYNTLTVHGTDNSGIFGAVEDVFEDIEGIVNTNTFEDEFPIATAQSPSLLQAAEGVELSPEIMQIDATTVAEAKRIARRELAQLLEEPSEGEIILDGEARILPFDAVDAFEVCNDFIGYQQDEVRYEVETVKHTKKAGEMYETRLLVSVWANDSNIEVEGTTGTTRGNI